MGCFLDNLRAFCINADQWATTGQDEEEWRRAAEKEAECLMLKWIAAEKVRVGLRHAVLCMPERDGKDQQENCLKQACSCWFARHC